MYVIVGAKGMELIAFRVLYFVVAADVGVIVGGRGVIGWFFVFVGELSHKFSVVGLALTCCMLISAGFSCVSLSDGVSLGITKHNINVYASPYFRQLQASIANRPNYNNFHITMTLNCFFDLLLIIFVCVFAAYNDFFSSSAK